MQMNSTKPDMRGTVKINFNLMPDESNDSFTKNLKPDNNITKEMEAIVKLCNSCSSSSMPSPSCLLLLFQKKSKCKTFHMKISLICIRMDLWVTLIFIRKVSHFRNTTRYVFIHRWFHFCRQIGDSWFQKRDIFWSLILQKCYSLIPGPSNNCWSWFQGLWSLIPGLCQWFQIPPFWSLITATPLIPDPTYVLTTLAVGLILKQRQKATRKWPIWTIWYVSLHVTVHLISHIFNWLEAYY